MIRRPPRSTLLSLHDALPICHRATPRHARPGARSLRRGPRFRPQSHAVRPKPGTIVRGHPGGARRYPGLGAAQDRPSAGRYYQHVPVGHVEAGLRTGDLGQPFPEELNRVLTTRLSTLHFAPTSGAAANLRREGVAEDCISVTGNTGIDAGLQLRDKLEAGQFPGAMWPDLDPSKRLLLVTAHRRENFGAPLEAICRALLRLAQRPDVQIVYPVHYNPNVAGPVTRLLAAERNIILYEPLDYVPFVDLMRRAYQIGR